MHCLFSPLTLLHSRQTKAEARRAVLVETKEGTKRHGRSSPKLGGKLSLRSLNRSRCVDHVDYESIVEHSGRSIHFHLCCGTIDLNVLGLLSNMLLVRQRSRGGKVAVAYAAAATLLGPIAYAQSSIPVLWGHAAATIPSPPTLLIQGGKTDPLNSYSYTSAPNANTVLALDLGFPFSVSAPPFRQINADGPSYAWHCLAPLGDDRQLVVFGGDGGPSLPVQTDADSTWLLGVEYSNGRVDSLSSTHEPGAWASQPVRRIYHSCASSGSKILITGGLKNDGSQIAYSDVYAFSGTSFKAMPSLPRPTYHHNTLLLPNGTLVVFGGLSTLNSETDLQSLEAIWTLDTGSSEAQWQSVAVAGRAPEPRRGATASLNRAGSAAVMIGGALRGLNDALAETWRLELGDTPKWTEVQDGGLARFDHAAVPAGDDQVLVIGGYGATGPVADSLAIFSFASNSYVNTFAPAQPPSSDPHEQQSGVSNSADDHGKSATDGSEDSVQGNENKATGNVNQSNPVQPTSTNAAELPPNEEKKSSLTLPIALGTILGILACAAAGLALVCYRRRVHSRAPYPGAIKGGGREDHQAFKRQYCGNAEKDAQGLLGWTEADVQAHGVYNTPIQPQRVRLVHGPRAVSVVPQPVPMFQRHLRSVKRVLSSGSRGPAADVSERFDMLVDEDSREFKHHQPEWALDEKDNDGWRSAPSLLNADGGSDGGNSDPFKDDGDDDATASVRPPVRGGPVPTPRSASLSSQNPFEDPSPASPEDLERNLLATASRHASLLPTPESCDSPSLNSKRSISTTGEPAMIQTATIASAQMSSYVPIKRSDTFLRRLAGGSFATLLGNRRGSMHEADIRDPAPPPALWPLDGFSNPFGDTTELVLNDPRHTSGSSRPPVAFKRLEDISRTPQGRSVSSLASAKTMRDMVVVQRERLDGTADSEWDDAPAAEQPCTPSTGTSSPHTPLAARHKTPEMTETPSSCTTSDFGARSVTPAAIAAANTDAKSSPVLPQKRRPVREVVESINRRSGPGTPLCVLSPSSITTAQNTPSPSRKKPQTIYEAVRKSALIITNPDDHKEHSWKP